MKCIIPTAVAVISLFLGGCGPSLQEIQLSRQRAEIDRGIDQVFAASIQAGELKSAMPVEHYVSPSGRSNNDGSMGRPWDLATALSQPAAVKPGDTIWLREGVYKGKFVSELTGRKSAPIVVRQYPGEHAVWDGCTTAGGNEATLLAKGEYTWYWGFEVTGCGSVQPSGPGVDLRGNDTKLINLVIHDAGTGISASTAAKRAEMSGNIVYFNGFTGAGQVGHGIDIQNEAGPKHLFNNIVFHQIGDGIHAYAPNGSVYTLDFQGNIAFSNGSLSAQPAAGRNIVIGGSKPAEGITLLNNSTYYPLDSGSNEIGIDGGCMDVTLQDNYFAGAVPLALHKCKNLRMTANSFAGNTPTGFSVVEFPENVLSTAPKAPYYKLRPDVWEAGRGFLAVFNWEHNSRLLVDVSELGWTKGQKYTLRNVEDFRGAGIQGVYDGEQLEVPMTNRPISKPLGGKPALSASPEFGAFVLQPN